MKFLICVSANRQEMGQRTTAGGQSDGEMEGRFRTANAAGHRLTANVKHKNPQALLTTQAQG